MARIRSVKPGFFSDIEMAKLPIPTRLTYIGLWTYLDDSGRGVDDARLIKAAVWPLDDAYGVRKVEADLGRLEAAGRIVRYEVDGRRYLCVPAWSRHQHPNRPQASTLPPCPFTDGARKDQGPRSEDARSTHRRRGIGVGEGVGDGGDDVTSPPPQDLGVAPPAAEEDSIKLETDVAAVARAVAQRRLQRRNGEPVKAPDEWLRKVAAQVRSTDGDTARSLLRQGRSAPQVVAALDPDGEPAPYAPAPPPSTVERSVERNRNGVGKARQAMR